MNKKVFIEGYNIVTVPKEIKNRIVHFEHPTLPAEINYYGSQIIDKCGFEESTTPDDIILEAYDKYPIKMGHRSSNNEYGDVYWADYNRVERSAYISGMLKERNKAQIDFVLTTMNPNNSQLHYYVGYFMRGWPVVTAEYPNAMKIPYREKAENLCRAMNESSIFEFKVEEHMYCERPRS